MWREIEQQRQRQSRTYIDNGRRTCCCSIAPLHYETEVDSGAFSAEIDCTLLHVNNSQLDGWHVTQNGWHYALGKPGDKTTDGWIGFGGRHGAHWFKFRLMKVGYLHWPSRTWQDVGGAPTYDRANLERETHTLTLGPSDDQINVESLVTWHGLWATSGGGELFVSWRVRGRDLKEEVTVNQAAREWVVANRPPVTPLDETWFGFVFQIDWSDVPRIVRDGVIESPDDDFADDGAGIELRDDLDHVFAFLPLSEMYAGNGKAAAAGLRKRFWKDADGSYYLLVGVRCDVLAALPDGDLVFDPTVTPQIAADNDECLTYPVGQIEFGPEELYIGDDGGWNHNGLRWQLNVPADANIISSKITFTADQDLAVDTVRTTIKYEDANDPGDFSGDDYAAFEARSRSATAVHWDFTTNWTTDTEYDTDDISTVIQALVNEAYWAANEHVVLFVEDDNSDNNAHRTAYGHSASAAKSAILTVEYSAALALAGTLTTAGTLVKRGTRTLAGTLTSAGALIGQGRKTLAGTLTTAGALVGRGQKVLAGTLTTAGALVGRGQKVLAGTLTTAGALVGRGQKVLVGTLTMAGALVRRGTRTLAGTLTTAGALIGQGRKTLAGTLTTAGVLVKRGTRTLAGTLTTAGVLVKRGTCTLAGTLTTAGTLVKRGTRTLAGTLTTAGVLVGRGQKVLVGTLTMAGALVRRGTRTLAGTLTTAGDLVRQKVLSVVLAGTLTTAGVLVGRGQKVLAGTLTTAGTLVKRGTRSLAGTLTTVGVLIGQGQKVLAGTLTTAGVLVGRGQKVLTGAIAPTGTLTTIKVVMRALAGTLTMSGTLAKRGVKSLAGTLTTAGGLIKRGAKSLAGTLTTAGHLHPVYHVIKGILTVRDALVTALTARDGVITKLGIGDSEPTMLVTRDRGAANLSIGDSEPTTLTVEDE